MRALYAYSDTRNAAQGNSQPHSAGDHPDQPWSYPSPTLTSHEPVLIELEQRRYGHIVHGHVVEFETLDGLGVNLHWAFQGETKKLIDNDQPAFPAYMDVKAKASIRIQICGIGDYTRQFMSLRSNKDATSISKGKLARTIAKEVKKLMKGDVLRVPDVGDFRMEEIYLTSLGVHLALQMASLWGAKTPLAPLVAASRRRRKADRMTVDQQRTAKSISASHWLCAPAVSYFGSHRSLRLGVEGRSRSSRRGVGRSSMRGIVLLCFRLVLSVWRFLPRQRRYSCIHRLGGQSSHCVYDLVFHNHPVFPVHSRLFVRHLTGAPLTFHPSVAGGRSCLQCGGPTHVEWRIITDNLMQCHWTLSATLRQVQFHILERLYYQRGGVANTDGPHNQTLERETPRCLEQSKSEGFARRFRGGGGYFTGCGRGLQCHTRCKRLTGM